jgi:hypothetical protein
MNSSSNSNPSRSLPEPGSVEEYIQYSQDTYDLVLWGGGKLRAYNLMKSHYQWIFFPVFLRSGYYRIALVLLSFPKTKPITAYAIDFPPDARNMENYPLSPLGFGFHITPAIASKNRFEIRRNTTKFATPLTGMHTVAVTTRDWFAEVEEIIFEVALLKSKMEYLYK